MAKSRLFPTLLTVGLISAGLHGLDAYEAGSALIAADSPVPGNDVSDAPQPVPGPPPPERQEERPVLVLAQLEAIEPAAGDEKKMANDEGDKAKKGDKALPPELSIGGGEGVISDEVSDGQRYPDPALMTRAELDLLQQLAARRTQIDARERELEIRARTLAATEKRIDGKINRLETIQIQIGRLIKQHDEQENAQLASIVTVYEKMRAQDAAKVFERLDIEIQLEVATRMKESKVAAILAKMRPEAAERLTYELATRARLPGADEIGAL